MQLPGLNNKNMKTISQMKYNQDQSWSKKRKAVGTSESYQRRNITRAHNSGITTERGDENK